MELIMELEERLWPEQTFDLKKMFGQTEKGIDTQTDPSIELRHIHNYQSPAHVLSGAPSNLKRIVLATPIIYKHY